MKNKTLLATAIGICLFNNVPFVHAQQAGTTTSTAAQENDVVKSQINNEDIERITITSRAINLYRPGETNTGKLANEPLNSTQVISSINASLIADQGARDAQDLYRNIAGVNLFSYAGVTARGFRQEAIFFDGLRGDPYVGFNVPQLFNVEQLDFLKGPAGMLYGPGEPGGIFNYVTKKPKPEFDANVRAIFGSDNRFGGSAEATGAVSEGHNLRVGLFYEERDTPRVNTNSETTIIDLGYSADIGSQLFTAQYTHYGQDLGGNRLRGVPVDDSGAFIVDPSWNHNEASDFLNLSSDVLRFSLEGQLSDSLVYNTAVRFISNEQIQNYHEPRALIDIDGDDVPDLVGREFRDQIREEETTAFHANFVYEGLAFKAEHRVAFGVEYFKGDFDGFFKTARFDAEMAQRFLTGSSLPSDIIPLRLNNPNYGQTDPSQYDTTSRNSDADEEQTGAYVLNELAWGKVTLVGGLRYDDFDTDTNVSLRLGGIYKLSSEISLFTQYADSFIPRNASEQRPEVGGAFDPTTGAIVEAGVNAELFNGGTQIKASVYRIVRDNFLQNTGMDPEGDGEDNLAALGEVISDGFELEVLADLTQDWVVSFAYAYNDTLITKGIDGGGIRNLATDKRFANAPKNTFGFWTRYQIPQYNLAFAFGGDYVDDRLSLSGKVVKDYLTFDASVIWTYEEYKVLLRIDNLTDEEYAESGFLQRTGHFPGAPREAFVEFSYKF